MKKKVIILISFIVIVCVGVIFGAMSSGNSSEIKNLLYEKYGENFKIVHDSGDEYNGGLLPIFNKTGYKNVIASPENNDEIKFNVRLKSKPLEIANDDYIPANIAYNTAKIIEKNNSIGKKMYVHISTSDYKCNGKITDSFFDNIEGQGSIVISVYVEGLDNKSNCKEYLNKIISDLNFDSKTTGIIRLYIIKENGVEEIKKYYKNSKDVVKVENADNSIKTKYFETPNKDYFINF